MTLCRTQISPEMGGSSPSPVPQLDGRSSSDGRSRQPSTARRSYVPEALPTTHLRKNICDLPPELVLEMADWLDTPDVGCLALCNPHLRNVFGTWSWRRPSANRPTQGILMRRLTRDWPDWYFCSFCQRLHLIRGSGNLFIRQRDRPRPPRCSSYWPHDLCSVLLPGRRHLKFRLNAYFVYSMMETHLDVFPIGDMLREMSFSQARLDSLVSVASVELRVVFGKLYARVQEQVQYHEDQGVPMAKDWGARVCEHIDDEEMDGLMRCKRLHLDSMPGCPTCEARLRCARCDVEFELAVMDRSGPTRTFECLTLTKWLDLGDGMTRRRKQRRRDIYPEYPYKYTRWQSMFFGTGLEWCAFLGRAIVPLEDGGDSARESFEALAGQSLEVLTAENLLITSIEESWQEREDRIERDRIQRLGRGVGGQVTHVEREMLKKDFIPLVDANLDHPHGVIPSTQYFVRTAFCTDLMAKRRAGLLADRNLTQRQIDTSILSVPTLVCTKYTEPVDQTTPGIVSYEDGELVAFYD